MSYASRSHHTLALGVSGQVWTWGSAEYGQQGGTNAYQDWATGVLLDIVLNLLINQHLAKCAGQRAEKAAALMCATPRRLVGCFDGKHIAHIACGHLHNIATARCTLLFFTSVQASSSLLM